MAKAFPGRYTAEVDGDFVVFLIGMRINKPWLPWRWWRTFRSMTPMLKSLRASPEKGLLAAYPTLVPGVGPTVIQYWRSVGHLDRFAKDAADKHSPMQRWFNTKIGYDGAVGIWHETYIVRAGDYEAIYGNMPRIGLAAGSEHVSVGKTNPWRHFAEAHGSTASSGEVSPSAHTGGPR
jgi:hypothetical protein